MIRVGINGFGRIGRFVLRMALMRKSIEVVAINDLMDVDYMEYLLKYDTMHGPFNGTVETDVANHCLIVNGSVIRVTQEKEPEKIDWGAVGAEYIVESTGLFLKMDKAEKHLKSGAKYVIMSAPSKKGEDGRQADMFVCGVNTDRYHGVLGNYYYDRQTGKEGCIETSQAMKTESVIDVYRRRGKRTALLTVKGKVLDVFGRQADIGINLQRPEAAVWERLQLEAPPQVASLETYEWIFKACYQVLTIEDPDFIYCTTNDYMMHHYAPDSKEAHGIGSLSCRQGVCGRLYGGSGDPSAAGSVCIW